MLKKIQNTILSFFKDEEGQTMVEYIIIVIVIAIAALVAFRMIGGAVKSKAEQAAASIGELDQPYEP